MPRTNHRNLGDMLTLVVIAASLFGAVFMCQFGPCCFLPLTVGSVIPAALAGGASVLASRLGRIHWRKTALEFAFPMLMPACVGATSLPDELPRLMVSSGLIIVAVWAGWRFGSGKSNPSGT
jgi:hypothetical protein